MPEGTTTPSFGDPRLPQSFWDKVRADPDGCWRWTRATNKYGYSRAYWNGFTQYGHRVTYAALVGEISTGMQIDHVCHDPAQCKNSDQCPHRRCVNPSHLRQISHAENMGKGRARNTKRDQTSCKRGHEFTDENTYIIPSTGYRRCLTCYRSRYPQMAERTRLKRAASRK